MERKKTSVGKPTQMKLPESKLPQDKKLTKESIVTADDMDAEISNFKEQGLQLT